MIITLCIPRVEKRTELSYVRSIFIQMNIGNLHNIYEIPLRMDERYKRVMIQMDINENDDRGLFILNRIRSGKDVKIVYKSPSYWKVYMRRINNQ